MFFVYYLLRIFWSIYQTQPTLHLGNYPRFFCCFLPSLSSYRLSYSLQVVLLSEHHFVQQYQLWLLSWFFASDIQFWCKIKYELVDFLYTSPILSTKILCTLSKLLPLLQTRIVNNSIAQIRIEKWDLNFFNEHLFQDDLSRLYLPTLHFQINFHIKWQKAFVQHVLMIFEPIPSFA